MDTFEFEILINLLIKDNSSGNDHHVILKSHKMNLKIFLFFFKISWIKSKIKESKKNTNDNKRILEAWTYVEIKDPDVDFHIIEHSDYF